MSQEIKSQLTTRIENGSLLIDIPLDLLVFTQEHREIPIYIIDKEEMEKALLNDILYWGGDSETGSTAFTDFLDNYFMDALENGELFLEGWWERENDKEDGG